MRGQVLGVDPNSGDGIVAGDDGNRYAFRPEDWAVKGEPAVGLHVDFVAQENRALTLFPVPGVTPAQAVAVAVPSSRAVPVTDRNKFVAAALAFFFGMLGIHRFYLGRTGSAVAMLVMTITVIGLFVTGPWALIDTIRYLMMSDDEFARRYPRR